MNLKLSSSSENISTQYIDFLKLENLKQYLNAEQAQIILSQKITENEDSIVSFLIQKEIQVESNNYNNEIYQENFRYLLRCFAYYLVSNTREEFLDFLCEEILINLTPEFIASALTSFSSFAENNTFSPEENILLVKCILQFNNLLKKINDQENLQEKLLHWFDEVEQLEVVPSELCTPYQQNLVDKYRAKGLTL